jgi:predicted metal-dependent enzyme (double-stranded beta helix superfamily)
MVETATRLVTVEEFVAGLQAVPGFETGAVFEFIKSHPVRPESLRPYLYFSPASYTRNLIFKCEPFELIAICWDVGQASRIHNHRDQQCWMAVPIGKLKNQNYRVLDRDPEKMTCRLEASSSFLITPASPLEVDQEEPVHQVLNLAEWKERAVSLHIYSRPFNTCEVYSLEKGTYCDVPLYYTSEYGKLCAGEQGEAAR